MPQDPDRDSPGLRATRERTREAGRSIYQTIHESAVAGLAVLVPLIITLLVLNAAVNYLFNVLDLLILILEGAGVRPGTSQLIVRGLVVALLAVAVLVVGFFTRFQFGELVIDYVDFAIQLVPGVGGVYKSFRQMSDVMLENDTKSFRDVKMVEFPHDDAYTMGFLTTATPDPLSEAAGRDDLVTLFLPLAPNPVMGGHLVHVPEDRVFDVDMTVEEGIQTVVTSGVATADPTAGSSELSSEQMRRMTATTGREGAMVDDIDPERPRDRRESDGEVDRVQRYEDYVRPDHPSDEGRPADVSDHRADDAIGHGADRPDDLTGPGGSLGHEADEPGEIPRDDDTLGREEDRPDAVERDHDGKLGRDEDRPDAVEDPAGTIGRDEDRPEEVADPNGTLGRNAETPEEVGEDESGE